LLENLGFDFALPRANILVLVFANGVVEQVFDPSAEKSPERLHLDRDLDAVDVELERHAGLDPQLSVFR
jgi:hypothetical protein